MKLIFLNTLSYSHLKLQGGWGGGQVPPLMQTVDNFSSQTLRIYLIKNLIFPDRTCCFYFLTGIYGFGGHVFSKEEVFFYIFWRFVVSFIDYF